MVDQAHEVGLAVNDWTVDDPNRMRSLARLGVDATKRVAVLGKLDADLCGEIDLSGAKVGKVTAAAREKTFDVVFLAVAAKADLEKMPAARELIADDGVVWAVFATPKKVTSPDELRERDVILSGRVLGLTDGKPQKLDDATTAIRFVVPPSARKKK